MSSRNGNGTAAVMVKTKKKKNKVKRIASHYLGKGWIPAKAKKLALAPMRLAMATSAPSTSPTSSVSANRYPSMLTLCYTLHAAQPIIYVTVTIAPTFGGVGGGQPTIVPVWSIDLTGGPSQDAYLQTTALPLDQAPSTNPVVITITYDTATQQNIPAFTVYV
jgi:hypothetical protein